MNDSGYNGWANNETYALAHPHAVKATQHEARQAFKRGAKVMVTERPEGDVKFVYPTSTVHSLETVSWEALAATVLEWRSRYPRQTWYIVQ